MLKNLDEDDRIQIQKEEEVLSNNPESEFFGKYNKAIKCFITRQKYYGCRFTTKNELT